MTVSFDCSSTMRASSSATKKATWPAATSSRSISLNQWCSSGMSWSCLFQYRNISSHSWSKTGLDISTTILSTIPNPNLSMTHCLERGRGGEKNGCVGDVLIFSLRTPRDTVSMTWSAGYRTPLLHCTITGWPEEIERSHWMETTSELRWTTPLGSTLARYSTIFEKGLPGICSVLLASKQPHSPNVAVSTSLRSLEPALIPSHFMKQSRSTAVEHGRGGAFFKSEVRAANSAEM